MNTEVERREELMTTIRNHWAHRGYFVKVWTEFVAPRSADGMRINGLGNYEIRSELINGLPRPETALFRDMAE